MRVQTSKFVNIWSQMKPIMSICYPREVVGGGSETQIQVGENLN